MRSLARRHPLGGYFALAFGISWTGSLVGMGPAFQRGEPLQMEELWLPGLLMISGPALAGLAMTALVDGRAGLRELLARVTRWRVGLRWYAPLLVFPGLILATLLPLALFVEPSLWPIFFAPGIAMGLVAGLFEELGWTGFAFPRMQAKHGLLGAALVFGFVHGVWHVPPDFLGNSSAFGAHWLPYMAGFFLFVMALRVLIAWVWANTGSVWLAQLMHASSTGSLGILVPIGIGGLPWAIFYPLYAVVLWGAVAIVLVRYGEALVRPRERAGRT